MVMVKKEGFLVRDKIFGSGGTWKVFAMQFVSL